MELDDIDFDGELDFKDKRETASSNQIIPTQTFPTVKRYA